MKAGQRIRLGKSDPWFKVAHVWRENPAMKWVRKFRKGRAFAIGRAQDTGMGPAWVFRDEKRNKLYVPHGATITVLLE
ncbi:hypothetical protein A5752_03050 [Mycobacterium sp. 852002-51961_SCH5331710]|nr:hypothetical protein A5752_03050 [Mycobacterium sp. 852002-51961_SCH5331710]